MHCVIVTGFGPFRGLDYNPSEALLRLLPKRLGDAEIETFVLPVSSRGVRNHLQELYRREPKVLIHTGLALGRTAVCIERLAMNLLDFEVPDNEGEVWTDERIVKDAIVRLQISAPEEVAGQLRDNEIREALKAAYFSTVAKDIKQEARPRLNQTAEEIPPLQALKTYLETNYTPERAQVLLEYGEKLIEGQTNGGN